jgi:cytochrome c-type biogenesis protein CcmH/NrfF
MPGLPERIARRLERRARGGLEPKTLLIWGAPFIMLVLGALIVVRIVRQRSRLPLDDEPSAGPT